MSYKIPFNKPALVGSESAFMTDAIARGHISGDGYYTLACQALLEEEIGVTKALLTTSCTHALEMAALLLDLQAGDEFITPSFTFVSSANAFVLRGAKPVFADIRPDTLNIDERQLEALITPRTRCIVVVHYAGVGCEMDKISEIAARHSIPIVEDNAHGLFARYKGRSLGTFGELATQSFHETKNFTCGEGGALLLNNQALIERAEIVREKGTDRSKFFRGQVNKYGWMDLGSSYLPSDLLAAFLLAQLQQRDRIQLRRKEIWSRYWSALSDWALERDVQLPFIPSHCEQPYHMFYLLLPSLETRENLINYLKARGILAVYHYLPLHLSEMGQRFGGKQGDCPITEDISDRLLRLPFFIDMTDELQGEVIQAVLSFDEFETRSQAVRGFAVDSV